MEAEESDAGVTPVDAVAPVDAGGVADAAPEDDPGSASGGCDCTAVRGGGGVPLLALFLLVLWRRRNRP